ncbi:hypothetical protein ACOSQ3_029026 [Xanthoceras sorbifolium]
MDFNKSVVGLGIIIRDHSGSVLAANAYRLAAGFSVMVAEALVVLKGLQFALDSGLLLAILETGSLAVITAINNPSAYLSKVGLVIVDIVDLLSSYPGSKVQFVPRSANSVAHTLARFTLSLDRDYFWLEDYPDCIDEVLVADNQVSG